MAIWYFKLIPEIDLEWEIEQEFLAREEARWDF